MEKLKRFKIKTEPRDLIIGGEIMHRRRIQDRNIKIGFAFALLLGVTLLALLPYFTNQ